ncbi:MAG: C40 family peptidase, partial [Deltaproteobacteria bacterium]|jgi:hypothetical protein|nr:C40 family peptidase [Deltaproteobacteria bacterium]
MGIKLPRTAREQSQVGRSVGRDDLRAGDIVAFRHPRRGWHSGIYMGDDQFVHSPRRRQQVRYSSMSNPYFRAHFVAARRVLEDGADLDYEAIARRVALAESEKRPSREEPGRELPKKRKSASQKSAKGKKTDKARGKAGAGATTFSGKDDRGVRL